MAPEAVLLDKEQSAVAARPRLLVVKDNRLITAAEVVVAQLQQPVGLLAACLITRPLAAAVVVA